MRVTLSRGFSEIDYCKLVKGVIETSLSNIILRLIKFLMRFKIFVLKSLFFKNLIPKEFMLLKIFYVVNVLYIK